MTDTMWLLMVLLVLKNNLFCRKRRALFCILSLFFVSGRGHVFKLGHTTTFQLSEESYVVVGWNRSRLTSLPEVPNCNLTNGYVPSRVEFGEHTDLPFVRFCYGKVPLDTPNALEFSLKPLSQHPTLCTVLWGGRSQDYANKSIHKQWLSDWMKTHHALGFSKFFVYSAIENDPLLEWNYDWFDISWVRNFDTHSGGQIWAMHDCLFRNRLENNAWTFFMDVDEVISFASKPEMHSFLRVLSGNGYQGASFGSVPCTQQFCVPADNLVAAMPYCNAEAECPRNPWFPDHNFCASSAGRRKYVVNVHIVNHLSTHEYLNSFGHRDFTDALHSMVCNASEIFIRHFRGAAYSHESCVGNSLCEMQSDVVNCSMAKGIFGDPIFVLKQARRHERHGSSAHTAGPVRPLPPVPLSPR